MIYMPCTYTHAYSYIFTHVFVFACTFACFDINRQMPYEITQYLNMLTHSWYHFCFFSIECYLFSGFDMEQARIARYIFSSLFLEYKLSLKFEEQKACIMNIIITKILLDVAFYNWIVTVTSIVHVGFIQHFGNHTEECCKQYT